MATGFHSLRGELLLDGGQLRGSFFHRSVVLICQHDPEGAFGLVLNQKTTNRVGAVVMAEVPESLADETLYVGGPVQPSVLSYLHADAFLPEANVIPNLSLGHSIEGLVDVASSLSPAKQVRLFAGYAGWTGGQLEGEMKRDAWVRHPATVDLVFDSDPDLWRKILRVKGWKYKLMSEIPDDLSWN